MIQVEAQAAPSTDRRTEWRDVNQLRSCSALSMAGARLKSLNSTAKPLRSGVQHMTPTFTGPDGKWHKRSKGHDSPSAEYCNRNASPLRVRRSQNFRGLPGKISVAQSDACNVSTLPMAGTPSFYSIPALRQYCSSDISMIPAWS